MTTPPSTHTPIDFDVCSGPSLSRAERMAQAQRRLRPAPPSETPQANNGEAPPPAIAAE